MISVYIDISTTNTPLNLFEFNVMIHQCIYVLSMQYKISPTLGFDTNPFYSCINLHLYRKRFIML